MKVVLLHLSISCKRVLLPLLLIEVLVLDCGLHGKGERGEKEQRKSRERTLRIWPAAAVTSRPSRCWSFVTSFISVNISIAFSFSCNRNKKSLVSFTASCHSSVDSSRMKDTDPFRLHSWLRDSSVSSSHPCDHPFLSTSILVFFGDDAVGEKMPCLWFYLCLFSFLSSLSPLSRLSITKKGTRKTFVSSFTRTGRSQFMRWRWRRKRRKMHL